MGCNPSSAESQTVGGLEESSMGKPVNKMNDIWDENYGNPTDGFYKGEMMIEDDLSYQLELHFSCSNLRDLDYASKTDPMCVLYEYNEKSLTWFQKGKTEMIKDALNPQFINTVVLRYRFEERQNLKIEVYDIDDEKAMGDLTKQTLVGSTEMYIHTIMRHAGETVTEPLTHPSRSNNGKVSIWGEQVNPNLASQLAVLEISANVARTQLFYKLYRSKEADGIEMVPVFRSEVRKGTNITWNPAKILGSVLCRNDFGRDIQIEVLEWVANGNHKVLHKQILSLTAISSSPSIIKFSKGDITILPYKVQKEYSFMEYLHGGLEISLTLAIDFTGSNGKPNNPSSLHYYDLNQNQYLRAIQAVGSVLEPYDFDGHIPVLGFGGMNNGITSHCYSISPPEGCLGIQGVFECYKNYLPTVTLSGPTHFNEIFKYAKNQAIQLARTNPNGYLVLMLLTDGMYMDVQDSINEIVAATKLPLSIIIVGVGNENLSMLERLDADEEPLRASGGQYMARDIIQFVPFNKYKDTPLMLASQTLAEIPRQVVVYFNKVGHVPH